MTAAKTWISKVNPHSTWLCGHIRVWGFVLVFFYTTIIAINNSVHKMAKLFEGRLCKNFTLFRLYYKLHGGKNEKKRKSSYRKIPN